MYEAQAINEAEDCTSLENPRSYKDRNNKKTKLSFSHIHIFKHYSFLDCVKFMPLSLSRSTVRPAQTLPTVQSSNKLVHEFVFIAFVILDLAFTVFRVKWFLMNSQRTNNEEWALSKRCPGLKDMGRHKIGHKLYSIASVVINWATMTVLVFH